jgi:hypothetical protein
MTERPLLYDARLCRRPSGAIVEINRRWGCLRIQAEDAISDAPIPSEEYTRRVVEHRIEPMVGRRFDEFRRQENLVATIEDPDEDPSLTRRGIVGWRLLLVGSPGDDVVAAELRVESADYRYGRCQRVDALVDEEPFRLPEFRRDTDRRDRWVIESFQTGLTRAEVAAIATAGRVRVRICNDVFEFGRVVRAAITRFSSMLPMIDPQPPPPPPAPEVFAAAPEPAPAAAPLVRRRRRR